MPLFINVGYRGQTCLITIDKSVIGLRYQASHAGPLKAKVLTLRPPSRRRKPLQSATADGKQLVEAVLEKIDQTDGGSTLSSKQQSSVNDLLVELEEKGRTQEPRPLLNPDIFGAYNVAFSSTQRAPRQEGQPAGGRFRSSWGRKLLQTTCLCQGIFQPNLVTNKIGFLLFGILPGSVGLRGFFEEAAGDKDTVKVKFQPPRLTLSGLIDLPIGPQSSVVLTTTYLTPTVRLGKGSRGSLFVFTKGGAADTASLEDVGLGRSKPAGWALLLAFLLGLGTIVQRLWTASTSGKIVAALPAAIFLFVCQAIVRDLFQRGPQTAPAS